MGSVGPMYTTSNYTNTISTKYTSKRHSIRYTILNQEQSTIPRQNLARYQVAHPDQDWEDAIDGFSSDPLFQVMKLNELDHFIDYQWNNNISNIFRLKKLSI